MAEKQFYVYKGTSIEGVDTSEFEINALITKKQFADNIQKNYAWEQKNNYTSDTQLIYDGEMTVTQTTLPDFDDYIEIVGGEVDPYHEYLYVQTETYKNGNQFCEFEIKMKGDTVLIYGEDYQITSRSDSFEVDTDPNSPNVTVRMYGTDAKNYYVNITPIKNYQGEIVLEFIINKKSISDAEYSYEPVTYTGYPQLPTFTFDFGTDIEGNEWQITSADETMFSQIPDEQTNANNYEGANPYEGTFKVSFQSKNYTGQIPVRWTINQKSTEISIDDDTVEVDGSEHGLNVTNNSSVDGTIYYTITEDSQNMPWYGNYNLNKSIKANETIEIGDVSDVGTHYIWAYFVPDDDNYSDSGTVMGRLTITEPETIDISECTVDLSQNIYIYNGNEQTPEVTVSYGNQTLTAADYDVVYPNDSTSAGTKTITITGKGNYAGETTAEYEIEKANPNVQLIGLEAPFNHNYQYCEAKNISSSSAHSTSGILYYGLDNGDGQRPMDKSVELNIGDTVKLNALLIGDSGEYTIWGVFIPTDQNNWNTLQNLTCILKITPIKLTSSNTQIRLTPDTFVYDGNPKTPEVSLVYDYYTGVDITPTNVTYQNNTNAGDHPNSATAIIEVNQQNYKGTLIAHFTIEQAESALQISVIGDGKYDGTGSHLLQFFTKLSEYPSNLPGIIYYGYEEGNYNNNVSINANGAPATASACWIQNVSDSPKTIYIKFEPTNTNYTTIETTYDLTLEPRELDGTMFAYNLIGNQSTFTYDGTQKTPGVTVSVKQSTGASGTTTVTEDNYTIQYGENINAGKDAGSVTIIGKNNLSGSFTLNFTINKKTPSAPNIITGQKYFSYDNNHNPANKTFNVTNNNNVAGTIIWSLTANYKYIDNSTYNTTYTKDNISIGANETLSVEFDYTVGTYEITAKFVPNDSSNYNESNSITATGLEILSDVTDIWISDTPASSFDTGTSETGNFKITQGSSIQLYVVGRESGWYGHDTDVDSRYVDISVASILETTDAGANYVNLTSGYELEGIAVGSTNGTPSDADYENFALHAEYINLNNNTKSHASNVTVKAAVTVTRKLYDYDNYIQDRYIETSQLSWPNGLNGIRNPESIVVCDEYDDNGVITRENVTDSVSISCSSYYMVKTNNSYSIYRNQNDAINNEAPLMTVGVTTSDIYSSEYYLSISAGRYVENANEEWSLTLYIGGESFDILYEYTVT